MSRNDEEALARLLESPLSGEGRDESLVEDPEIAELAAIVRGLSKLADVPEQDEDPGQPIFVGKYEVRDCLGRGGQSAALLAFDHDLHRLVVLKLYHRTETAEQRARVVAEGQRLSQIRCPHLAQCFGVEREGNIPYLILEYIPGYSLEKSSRRWERREIISFLKQLADGVLQIHKAGFVHCDLKPSNVIIDPVQSPRIIDFGFTADQRYPPDSGRTPAYAAPEQVRDDLGAVGPATDIFGIGGVLYFLLTGKSLYRGATRSELDRHAAETSYDPLDYEELRRRNLADVGLLCERCLATRPEDRISSAAALRKAARRLPIRPIRAARIASALAGFVLVTLGIILGTLPLWNDGQPATPPARSNPPRSDRTVAEFNSPRRPHGEATAGSQSHPGDLYTLLDQIKLLKEFSLELELPNASVDSEGIHHFRPDMPMLMKIQTDRDAHIRVFSVVRGEKTATQILPNRSYERDFIRAGEVHSFPDGNYTATYTPSTDLECIYLLASPNRINLEAHSRQLDVYTSYDSHQMADQWRGWRGVEVTSRALIAEVVIPIRVAGDSRGGDGRTEDNAIETTKHDSGRGDNIDPAAVPESIEIDTLKREALEIYQQYTTQGFISAEQVDAARACLDYARRTANRDLEIVLHMAISSGCEEDHRYDEALRHASDALNRVAGSSIEELAAPRCQHQCGRLLTQVGRYDEALAAFEHAAAGYPPGDLYNRARLNIDRAIRAARVGAIEQAIALYRKGIATPVPSEIKAEWMMDLARIQSRNGDYQGGFDLIKRALKENSDLKVQARGYHELGHVAVMMGDVPGAHGYYRRSLQRQKTLLEKLPEQSAEWAYMQHHIGLTYLALGDHATALQHIRHAIAAMPSELSANVSRQALVAAQRMAGDYQQCERTIDEAMAVYQAAGQPYSMINLLYERASLRYDADGFAAAADDVQRVLQLSLEHYERNVYAMTAAEAAGFSYDLQRNAMRLLQIYSHDRVKNRFRAYQKVWNAYGMSFRMQRRNRGAVRIAAQTDPEAAALHQSLIDVTNQMSRLVDPQRRLALRARRTEVERKLQRVIQAPALNRPAVALSDFVKLLQTDQAYIHYVSQLSSSAFPQMFGPKPQFETSYEAFVIRPTPESPGYQVHWVALGPSGVIDQAIAEWTSWIDYRCSASATTEHAWYRGVKVGPAKEPKVAPEQRLRQLLWEPIERYLNGTNRVVITPDAGLARVAWAALPGKDANRFLLEDYTISTLGHGDELVRNRSNASRRGPLLAVGGVDYGTVAGAVGSYPGIAGSAREARAIAQRWTEGVELLTGADATLEAILAALPDVTHLHLATHGHYELPQFHRVAQDRQRELLKTGSWDPPHVAGRNQLTRAGLALAGANTDPAGYWTGEQIAYRYDLQRVDLVALSSCHSAAGQAENWSGTYSLQRAFSTAGARSVLGSLWPVHDEATHQLMVLFYNDILEGTPKSGALRNAQLELLRNPTKYLKLAPADDKVRLSPHLWAGWQLYGDWK